LTGPVLIGKKHKGMVSIILPCFNSGKYLSTAVDSILNQIHQNWELIVINDGSTDNTKDIISGYKDSRIQYFYHPNRGISKTRNVGLERMKGDYFCFLDADDFLPPGSLESRLKVFQNNPIADFVDGAVHIYNQTLDKKQSEWIPSYRGYPLDQLLLLSGNCFFGNTWLIRRKKDKIYRFHESLTHGEDLLFYIELAFQDGHYDYTDDVVLHYRSGHLSAMKNLKGLEIGYRYIYQYLLKQGQIQPKKVEMFKIKARNILLKSYLGNLKPYQAFVSLVKKW
jgi:teichuronic acid biosynthesis glycosyltransferase TuaG